MASNGGAMQRINVTGNAGSGKSTLAALLGEMLGLDVIGLDRIVWQPGWRKTPSEERLRLEREIIARPRWIVDGVSDTIRTAADTVVFLDYPRSVVLRRCAGRNVRYLFRSRPGLPPGCPEILIVPTLVRLIWRFHAVGRPKILADFERWHAEKTLVHIRSDAERGAFLSMIRGWGDRRSGDE